MFNRYFIITKRGNPIKFENNHSNEYNYSIVSNEKEATIIASMVELMNKLTYMINQGESGLWYKEISVNEHQDEHEYIMESVINTELKYISTKIDEGKLYWTKRKTQALRFKELSQALEFALNRLTKETINELRIVDLKESEQNKRNDYLYSNGDITDEMEISSWERMTDYEAFTKFSQIIEQELDITVASDIFKEQMIKLMGNKKYAIIETDKSRQEAKNALINIFSKLIELNIASGKHGVFYIEWYIRNKLMNKEENNWLVKTKWFNRNKRVGGIKV